MTPKPNTPSNPASNSVREPSFAATTLSRLQDSNDPFLLDITAEQLAELRSRVSELLVPLKKLDTKRTLGILACAAFCLVLAAHFAFPVVGGATYSALLAACACIGAMAWHRTRTDVSLKPLMELELHLSSLYVDDGLQYLEMLTRNSAQCAAYFTAASAASRPLLEADVFRMGVLYKQDNPSFDGDFPRLHKKYVA